MSFLRSSGSRSRNDQWSAVPDEAPDRLWRYREPRSLLPGLRHRRPGAFIVPVRQAHDFVDAIRTKLVREIAGISDPEPPLVKPAQDRQRMNCLIGEFQRRQRLEP